MASDEMEQAVALLRDALEPQGWTVAEGKGAGDRIDVRLEHELSSSMTVVLDPHVDPVRHAERFLSSAEIAAVATAPAEMPHRALLASLRSAATGAGPSASRFLPLMARALERHELLTPDESLWLDAAGVPGCKNILKPDKSAAPVFGNVTRRLAELPGADVRCRSVCDVGLLARTQPERSRPAVPEYLVLPRP